MSRNRAAIHCSLKRHRGRISNAVQARYGSPIVCLDLVKAIEKHPREIALRSEFDVAISYINQTVRAGLLQLPHVSI